MEAKVGGGDNNVNKEKVCVVCGSKATKFCGSCLSTYYCSQDHQKSDWKTHRKTCPPMRIHYSEELGQHYVATRDLKAGQPILTESAVFVHPIDGEGGPENICIMCCSNGTYTCKNCSWLMCASDKCQKKHVEECQFFKHHGLTKDIGFGICSIIVYRAIFLKKEKPEVWAHINDLQYLEKSIVEDRQCKKEVVELFKILDIPESDLTLDELEKFLQIAKINGYTLISSGGDKSIALHVSVLFDDASLFTNNCFANCDHCYGSGPNFAINIWTSVPVTKGQVLSVVKESNSPRSGSMVKQKENKQRSRFSCVCPRCVDPTELKTMMSGIKCVENKCSNGYLLPINPADLNPNSLWKCTQIDCAGNETWENIDKKTSELMAKVEEFHSYDNDYDVKKLDELLKKSLHSNHWIISHFNRNLVDTIMSKVGKHPDPKHLFVSKEMLNFGLACVKNLLELSDTTTPGLNFQRAELFSHQVMMKIVGQGLYAFLDSKEEELKTRQLLDDFMLLKKLSPSDALGINLKFDYLELLKLGYENGQLQSMVKLLGGTHISI